MALENIERIVVVLLENRSFDHALGYLSLPDAAPTPMKVNGLKDDQKWLDSYANADEKGKAYSSYPLKNSTQKIDDPPHDLTDIDKQINTATHSGAFSKMGGFVRSYEKAIPAPSDKSKVMGYYKKDGVPVFDFFARNFAVCDNWFSPLPTGTQANRLVAMSGESKIYDNVSDILHFPDQDLVYDWLNAHAVEWCSYQWAGFPFFTLMGRWRGKIFASWNDPFGGGDFRRYNWFGKQWGNGELLPSVIFIEPKYTDDTVHRFSAPNDDHSPTGIAPGQDFLADIYSTLTSNPTLWAKTMLIVTYDEHGGFFDHVPPLNISATAGTKDFVTTGVRVPAFVISPHVEPGTVFSAPLDHTSILQLLADRFSSSKKYSDVVSRRQSNLGSLKDILVKTPPKQIRTPKITLAVRTTMKTLAAASHGVGGSPAPSSSATSRAFESIPTPSV